MTEPRHTPGPWHIDREYDAAPGHVAISSASGPHEHLGLAQVVVEIEDEPYAQGVANAQLIAAAPELYAALEPIAQAGEIYRATLAKYIAAGEIPARDAAWDHLAALGIEAVLNAHSALAKARGEA